MTAPAPTGMPSEEEIVALVKREAVPVCQYDDDGSPEASLPDWRAAQTARAILNLFAPILAEKERRDALDREQAETARFLQQHLDNPRPPSDALRGLLTDYEAAGVQSVGLDSPFNACCHREECRNLEARALAAEAALAAERERCAKIAENQIREADSDWAEGFSMAAAGIAAAIRYTP